MRRPQDATGRRRRRHDSSSSACMSALTGPEHTWGESCAPCASLRRSEWAGATRLQPHAPEGTAARPTSRRSAPPVRRCRTAVRGRSRKQCSWARQSGHPASQKICATWALLSKCGHGTRRALERANGSASSAAGCPCTRAHAHGNTDQHGQSRPPCYHSTLHPRAAPASCRPTAVHLRRQGLPMTGHPP